MPVETCPNCTVKMQEITRSGVEVDICPQCRGIWLDRGELEKLLTPIREMKNQTPTKRRDEGKSIFDVFSVFEDF